MTTPTIAPPTDQTPPARTSRGDGVHHGIDTGKLVLPALALVVVGALLPILVIAMYSIARFEYGELIYEWNLDNYLRFLGDKTYAWSLASTVGFVALVAIASNLVALPYAYFVATKVPRKRQFLWLAAAALPFFSAYLVRVICLMNLMGDNGMINTALMAMGLTDAPLEAFGYGRNAIILTFVYLQSPILVLILFVAINKIDGALGSGLR